MLSRAPNLNVDQFDTATEHGKRSLKSFFNWKRKLQLPPLDGVEQQGSLFHDPPFSDDRIVKLPLSQQFRFLNKAVIRCDGESSADDSLVNTWRFYSIQQVEEVIDEVPNSSPSPPPVMAKPNFVAAVSEEQPKKSYALIVKVKNVASPVAPVLAPISPTPVRPVSQVVPAPMAAPTLEAPAASFNSIETNNIQEEEADSHSVYIKNLPLSATPAHLKEEFKKFRSIKTNGIQVRSHKQQEFYFGFVEFEDVSVLVSKQLEESNALLQDAKSEISVLIGKVRSLEEEVTRQKANLYESKSQLDASQHDALELGNTVEILKSELQTPQEEDTRCASQHFSCLAATPTEILLRRLFRQDTLCRR